MDTISIYFDGGCRPTNPGNKYGSYEVMLNDTSVKIVNEAPLGWGTNNEAEFEILIASLDWTVGTLRDWSYPLIRYRIELFTDSTIVRNRLQGRNKTRKSEPQQRMFTRTEACLGLIRQFNSFSVEWQPRERNVERFGH